MAVWAWRFAAVPSATVVIAMFLLVLSRPIERCGEDCPITEQVDRQLAERVPRLVVLGNSMARRDVDLEVLAGRLGFAEEDAMVLALPGTSPGSWYALLKYRVFGRGHRPTHVVVVGALRSFFVTRPVVGADVAALVQLAGSEDPTVRRIAGETSVLDVRWSRVDLRRRAWRTAIIDGLARATRSLQAAAGVPFDPEMEEVFGVAGGDPRGLKNMFGGLGHDGELTVTTELQATYVPELVRLAEEQDTRLVFARVPPRRELESDFEASHPEAEEALGRWLEENGSAYVAMKDVRLPPGSYADAWHLTPAGAVEYTTILARKLQKLGFAEDRVP